MPAHVVEARLEAKSFDADLVHVLRLRGREAINEPFELQVDLVTDGDPLDPEDVIGTTIGVQLWRDGQLVRTIHGCAWSLGKTFDFVDDRHVYRLHVVPRLRYLSLIRTQELFLDMSIPEIVGEKLEGVELADSDVGHTTLMGHYPKRELVVQFDETDLAFVSRLCEHLGIAYFFDHRHGRDRVVFTDATVGFGTLEGHDTLQLSAHEGQADCVRTLSRDDTIVPDEFWVMDYDYRKPTGELTTMHQATGGFAGGVFEYGPNLTTLAQAEQLAKVRAEEAESNRTTFRGTSDALAISAGHAYSLDGHPALDGESLLVVSVEHDLVNPAPFGDSGGGEPPRYTNTFTAIPGDQMYRPSRRTPKPRIAGLLTAVVEPDEYGVVAPDANIDHRGRYRVKFLFDTTPLGEQPGSKLVRMALPYAGPRYGSVFPLHPGVEVAVGFENGDPDRPVIVGALHNHGHLTHVDAKNLQMSVVETASGIRMSYKDANPRPT